MSKIGNLCKLIKIFATKESYAIGYRQNSDAGYKSKEIYRIIRPTKTEWYADPFLFEYNKKTYLFAEIMKEENKGRGIIGACCLSDNETNFKTALSEDFHLSYPYVFLYQNDIYMIPETFSSNQLRLYKCNDFPYSWELSWTILDNVHFVDTTLLFVEDIAFAETYDLDCERNRFFKIDIQNGSIVEIEPDVKTYVDRRPGGAFIKNNGKIFHMLQHNDRLYGEYLHVAEVETFNDNGLREREIGIIKSKDIPTDVHKRFTRIHTYNQTRNFEVIDLLYNMIIPERFIPRMIKYLKKRIDENSV